MNTRKNDIEKTEDSVVDESLMEEILLLDNDF